LLRSTSAALTVLLGVLIALTPLGTDTWAPTLAALGDSLGASVRAAQLTVTAFFAGIAAGQLGWGPVSDRYGRKPCLLAGLAIACAATAAGAAASNIEAITLARFVQGLGMSCGPVIARSIVRDLHSHEQAARLFSSMTIVFSVVPIAGPLVGAGLLVAGGWRAVLAFYAVVNAILFVAVMRGVRETAPAERGSMHPLRLLVAFRDILAEPRFLAPFGAMLLGQMGIFAFVTNSAFVLIKGQHIAPLAYGLLFAGVMLGQITGAWASGRLVIRLGIPRMLKTGAALALASGGSAALLAWAGVSHWLAVLLPFMVYTGGMALITPNATASALTPFPRTAGAASSLIGASQFAVGATVSALLGILFDGTARPMASVAAIGGAGAFLIERYFLREKVRDGNR
jgi:DHA1 family bicyclomycin/chloramphenicol resistance-like MFS transporter